MLSYMYVVHARMHTSYNRTCTSCAPVTVSICLSRRCSVSLSRCNVYRVSQITVSRIIHFHFSVHNATAPMGAICNYLEYKTGPAHLSSLRTSVPPSSASSMSPGNHRVTGSTDCGSVPVSMRSTASFKSQLRVPCIVPVTPGSTE